MPELDEELRKQYLHLLYKMCKGCKMLPTSCTLQPWSLSVDGVCYRGRFADVSTGYYLGCRVAVKCLRFGTRGRTDQVFEVLESLLIWYFCCDSLRK